MRATPSAERIERVEWNSLDSTFNSKKSVGKFKFSPYVQIKRLSTLSGEVLVDGRVGGVALEVLAGDEVLDPLLDLPGVGRGEGWRRERWRWRWRCWWWWRPICSPGVGLEVAHQLRRRLEHQLLVIERLPRLHDPHNRRLDRVLRTKKGRYCVRAACR